MHYNGCMRKKEFIDNIAKVASARPYRIVTYVKGFGFLKKRREERLDLPYSVLARYKEFMLESFKGFETEPGTRQNQEGILYSLSQTPSKPDGGSVLFETTTLYQSESRDDLFSNGIKTALEEAKKNETFSDMLIRLQNRKDMRAPDLYHKAGIDSKHFSKIISDRSYNPKKETVFALALALQLDLKETTAFLESAGYAFNPSSMFDMTMKFFIQNGNYDRIVIDMLMESLDIPLLPQNW